MKNLNSTWRKTASTVYKKPADSKIFGSVEIDITDLNRYIAEKRKGGLKVTPTHIITLATARAVKAEIPEMNTFIRRGNVISHEQIDVTVSVLLKGAQMGSVKLEKADELTLEEAVNKLTEKIKIVRRQTDESQKLKSFLAAIPWPFRKWFYSLAMFLSIDLGIKLPGVNPNDFGAFIISNIGSLGLDIGYPALLPSANLAFVLVLGGIREKPWVVNGEIVPRTIMKLGIAIDHRVLDASHGGILFKYIKKVVRNPESLEKRLTLPNATLSPQ
jgi:pyruvate/2-oxoglutarate dehydrogenase complex dihydrolipoamide acyltransferase (E2) component